MKRNSVVTQLLAGLLIAGSLVGLLTSGGIQLILFVFGGKANVSPGMLILLAKFAFYLLAGIMVLMNRKLGYYFACISGLLGVLSGVGAILRDGFGQPQLTYLIFHGIFLAWFISVSARAKSAETGIAGEE